MRWSLGGRLDWLRRRGWVLAVSVVVVTIVVAGASKAADTVYIGEAIAVVPSGAGEGKPGSAGEANKLAFTYAGLIPQDGRVRARVAATLGRRATGAIVSFNDPQTALVRLRYENKDPAVAVRGARAIAEAVTGPDPITTAIAPDSLLLSRLPERAFRKAGPTNTPIPIGVTLGLFLGVVLVAAWARADPRVDNADALRRTLSVPVTDASALTATSTHALLTRWMTLAGSSPAHVAMVPVGGPPANDLSRVLLLIGRGQGVRVAVGERNDGVGGVGTARDDRTWNALVSAATAGRLRPAESEVDLVLVRAGEIGSEAAGEAVALACDLTVLVVRGGTQVAAVTRAVTTLAQFGLDVAWAVLVTPSSTRRAGRIADGAEAERPSQTPQTTANVSTLRA
jgi:hypothetical protein